MGMISAPRGGRQGCGQVPSVEDGDLMRFQWGRRARGQRAPRRLRAWRYVESTELEARRLQAIGAITAIATPKILTPDNGQFIAVTVTGKIDQVINTTLPGHQTSPPPDDQLAALAARAAKRPPPSLVRAIVTDQYRQVEPRLDTHVGALVKSKAVFLPATQFMPHAIESLSRTYSYSFTIYLQAKASSIGRQYDITVFVKDTEGANQFTIGVATAEGLHHK
jgi:hypothetical protein